MTVTILLMSVSLLFLWRVLGIFRTKKFLYSQKTLYVTAVFVWAAQAAAMAIELTGPAGPIGLWLQIALVGAVALVFTIRYRHLHRTGRTLLSAWGDFLCYCVAMSCLVAALLTFAGRLTEISAFAALMVGFISVFMPINCIAEVFHEDLQEHHV